LGQGNKQNKGGSILKLTPKQKIFVDEYLIDLNATRAYKVAYTNVKKDETAAVNGSRMIRNAKVENYIEERMKEREKRTEITQDKVLKELAKIGFAKGTDFAKVMLKQGTRIKFDTEGKEIGLEPYEYQTVEIVNSDELTEDSKSVIAGIKQGANGVEVKLNDKVKALELIGRHLGMFSDKLELSGEVNTNSDKLDKILEQLNE